jgi:hypothetical protein
MSMFKIISLTLLALVMSSNSNAQSVLRVPSVQAITGSNTHFYVLSSTEGLVVFRASGDSLIYLYTSDALLRRGNKMRSDARFAYLYGNDSRLTVIDPTVSQALYSVAVLPAEPMGLARIGSRLYLAMGTSGLAVVSLSDPANMENTYEMVQARFGPGESAIDIVAQANRIFVLGSTGTIYPFIVTSGTVSQEAPVATGFNAKRIFASNGSILLTTDIGNAIQWSRPSFPAEIATIGSAVTDAHLTSAGWVVRTEDARLWKIENSLENRVSIIRDNSSAGNYITINKGTIWISEFGRISTLTEMSFPLVTDSEEAPSNQIRISKVSDRNIPFPQPLLVSFTLDEGSDQGISWYVRHSSRAVPVRGNALIWQPSSSEIGTNRFTVIASNSLGASDSLTFNVEVRQFNAPPRLTPTRPVSIPVDEEFTLQLVGIDPDGSDSDLVRYTGVNLPDGIVLDPQTGLLRWTPNDRQLGRHVLQIITSDQFGASMSNEVILNVIRMRR